MTKPFISFSKTNLRLLRIALCFVIGLIASYFFFEKEKGGPKTIFHFRDNQQNHLVPRETFKEHQKGLESLFSSKKDHTKTLQKQLAPNPETWSDAHNKDLVMVDNTADWKEIEAANLLQTAASDLDRVLLAHSLQTVTASKAHANHNLAKDLKQDQDLRQKVIASWKEAAPAFEHHSRTLSAGEENIQYRLDLTPSLWKWIQWILPKNLEQLPGYTTLQKKFTIDEAPWTAGMGMILMGVLMWLFVERWFIDFFNQRHEDWKLYHRCNNIWEFMRKKVFPSQKKNVFEYCMFEGSWLYWQVDRIGSFFQGKFYIPIVLSLVVCFILKWTDKIITKSGESAQLGEYIPLFFISTLSISLLVHHTKHKTGSFLGKSDIRWVHNERTNQAEPILMGPPKEDYIFYYQKWFLIHKKYHDAYTLVTSILGTGIFLWTLYSYSYYYTAILEFVYLHNNAHRIYKPMKDLIKYPAITASSQGKAIQTFSNTATDMRTLVDAEPKTRYISFWAMAGLSCFTGLGDTKRYVRRLFKKESILWKEAMISFKTLATLAQEIQDIETKQEESSSDQVIPDTPKKKVSRPLIKVTASYDIPTYIHAQKAAKENPPRKLTVPKNDIRIGISPITILVGDSHIAENYLRMVAQNTLYMAIKGHIPGQKATVEVPDKLFYIDDRGDNQLVNQHKRLLTALYYAQDNPHKKVLIIAVHPYATAGIEGTHLLHAYCIALKKLSNVTCIVSTSDVHMYDILDPNAGFKLLTTQVSAQQASSDKVTKGTYPLLITHILEKKGLPNHMQAGFSHSIKTDPTLIVRQYNIDPASGYGFYVLCWLSMLFLLLGFICFWMYRKTWL